MAIALDSATQSTFASPNVTWTHTIGAGSNLLLVVGVMCRDSTAQPSVSGVTYNSVAMTKARADQTSTSSTFMETSVWLLHAPTTGANSVVATFTGSGSPKGVGVSASYTGAQQSDSADASNGKVLNGSTVGDQTFSVTTVSNNCWIFAISGIQSSSAPTNVPDQTQRGTNVTGTVGSSLYNVAGEDTNGVVTPAGAKTMGFTLGNGGGTARGWAMTGASFAPAGSSPGATATGGNFTLMGVG